MADHGGARGGHVHRHVRKRSPVYRGGQLFVYRRDPAPVAAITGAGERANPGRRREGTLSGVFLAFQQEWVKINFYIFNVIYYARGYLAGRKEGKMVENLLWFALLAAIVYPLGVAIGELLYQIIKRI